MGDIINMKRAGKRIAKEQSAKQADLNRARFGQTKQERDRQTKGASRSAHHLDQHRLEPENS